ncbi:tRNA (adenosine(37)-N6)-threonylcarbamoyltransferase complex ATPase subunit type 1 TsaE [Poriferisphaera sp. WC338]|uniref:tRNA (adenosine(37)-N6)-threonylcarbamoyltransferase complex ATPase subunit type 1 TsaE n=1 Tax=Poriferisphaera sp. WC338 TaxID=3425129 RepID=UPI003D812AB0
MTRRKNILTATSNSVGQTVALGRLIGSIMREGEIIGLIGDLGAGKTQFVRGLAEGLGIRGEVVSSPTFVVMQEYEQEDCDGEESLVLVHIDAYRLESARDLASIGWDEEGNEIREGAVVAIEWANMLESFLPDDTLHVNIQHANDGRQIQITGLSEAWDVRLESTAKQAVLDEVYCEHVK